MPGAIVHDPPASFLVDHILKRVIHSRLFLITGPPGVGKTTWCAATAVRARQAGLTVCGLISPAVYNQGEKIAIDLVDLVSGECRNLGHLSSYGINGLTVGRWVFLPEAILWGNKLLQGCSAQGWASFDLLILDEIGPLEFKQEGGFEWGMRLVDQFSSAATRQVYDEAAGSGVVAVVIRPKLLALARERWPQAVILNLAGAGCYEGPSDRQDIH